MKGDLVKVSTMHIHAHSPTCCSISRVAHDVHRLVTAIINRNTSLSKELKQGKSTQTRRRHSLDATRKLTNTHTHFPLSIYSLPCYRHAHTHAHNSLSVQHVQPAPRCQCLCLQALQEVTDLDFVGTTVQDVTDL